jgi:hypothetical protein
LFWPLTSSTNYGGTFKFCHSTVQLQGPQRGHHCWKTRSGLLTLRYSTRLGINKPKVPILAAKGDWIRHPAPSCYLSHKDCDEMRVFPADRIGQTSRTTMAKSPNLGLRIRLRSSRCSIAVDKKAHHMGHRGKNYAGRWHGNWCGVSLAIKSLLRSLMQSNRALVMKSQLFEATNVSVAFCNDRTVAILSNVSSREVPSGRYYSHSLHALLGQGLSIFVHHSFCLPIALPAPSPSICLFLLRRSVQPDLVLLFNCLALSFISIAAPT